jgi:hypothetical protein
MGRRRRRESRRNGKQFKMHHFISKFSRLLARTLIDRSNSGSPTAGRLSNGGRSVREKIYRTRPRDYFL